MVGNDRTVDLIVAHAGIIRGAVAVKQDNAAGLDRIGNGVDRRGLRFIIVERALGLRGDALALFVILARE